MAARALQVRIELEHAQLHTQLNIISPTLVLQVKMTDTSVTVQAADVHLIKMKFVCSLTHFL